MLSNDITDLLSIEYRGLFDDHEQCFALLAAKRDSGDADTPPALTENPLFDLSPDLFLWVTQKHLENDSGHLVARDVMSNIATAGLSGSYGTIVDMLADAGHAKRGAQIWRADVASHMDAYREFLRAQKAVARYEALPDDKRPKSAPDRFQRKMARDYPQKKQAALAAVAGFEQWLSRYGGAERHAEQISLWKAELETEAKPKLAPPDKTPMSTALFWDIIEDSQSGSESETVLNIEDRLVTYTPKAIRDAAKTLQSLLEEAYRAEVWALAYLLRDGCSDDAFEDFRNWIILRGQSMYNDVLTAPDGFDPSRISGADLGAAGGLMSAFENAYLSRAGKPLTLPRRKNPSVDVDETTFAALLPTVSAKLAQT